MSKKILKRNLAVISGSALAISSFVALPAQAAFTGADIAFSATTGDKLAVFTLDELDVTLDMTALIPNSTSGTDLTNLHLRSEDGPLLAITFADVTNAEDGATVKAYGLDADGDAVAINGGNAITVVDNGADADITDNGDTAGSVLIDFAGLGITDLVLYDIAEGLLDNSVNLTFEVMDQAAGDGSDYTYTVAEKAADALSEYGDGSYAVSLRSWLDTDGDDTTIDANRSDVVTMSWFDQAETSAVVKVERFNSGADLFGLDNAETAIPAVITFSKAVNLDQIDLDYWEFDVDSSVAGDDGDNVTPTKETLDGLDNQDDHGKLTVSVDMDGADVLDDGEKVAITVQAQNAAGNEVATARVFRSAQATVLEAADDTTDGQTYTVAPAANLVDDEAGTVTAREGTKAITYTSALDDGGVAQGANRPVMAVVTFTDAADAGDTLTVSGHSRVLVEDGVAVVTGLTNSDGEFDLTVTASNPEDGADYTVEFFYIDVDGDDNAADVATITTTYETTDYEEISSDSTVYNGSSVKIDVDVVDQFGSALSKTADGDAISIRFEATNTDDLEKFVAVSAGSASISFTNWLAVGETDVITITAYTGDSDDPTDLAGALTVTLYNSANVTGVTVTADELEADVEYADFVTSGDEGYVVAGNATELAGSAIAADGQGVPGAQVKITGAGLQFQDAAGDFAVGTITVTADEAGAWSVDVWTHLADDTDITITSGTGKATATLTGVLAVDTAANLKLSWNLPAAVAYNTTYAVTAKLTDVWGNPVSNATLTFAGEAAAQFNADVEVAKTTNSKGTATAYLRSLEDVTGLAAVSVTLSDDINYDGAAGAEITDVGDTFTNDTDTSWDESAATDAIEAEINFLKSVSASAGAGGVNVGSFNGKLVVYAKGLSGKTISWKVGGKWGKAVASSNYSVFNRPTPVAGATVTVDIYVNGVKTLTKSVVTR